ncbi:hypothetical protein OG725_15885 [Streptomyces sp. NBC_01213]|uniref:hypothetical protein n=1 Tax=Streptomyces sp. NBC_01213 TaxID=2903776 RepID=UPI00352F69B6|nr:hypothetical protein OG725_15885 [Streptomyces sp. NBC_01213]
MGRRGELAVFRETFARDPEEADFPYLFHVRGNGGVGKSTLVRQWESTAREQASVVTAYVDDEVHDAIEAMEAVSAGLGRQGHPLKRFDKQLTTYRQRRHQAESAASAPQPGPGEPGAAVPSPSSTVVAQMGLAGLGALVPGAALFTGAVDSQQVALGADRVRAMLNTRLRSHDDVQLVMNPLTGLAPVFLDDLADVAERCERGWCCSSTCTRGPGRSWTPGCGPSPSGTNTAACPSTCRSCWPDNCAWTPGSGAITSARSPR